MKIELIHGDCLEEMKKIPDNSVASIVTDPPYELGFMGKSWDSTGIANNVEMWRECLRVLKPGGHLLAFSGTRTYHRMASAIEDAGFEVRDMIEWVYGCLSEDTEILTESGYKPLHKLTQYDRIGVYDIANNIYKWERPQRYSVYKVHQDTAYRIKSDYTDQIVSRNHRCLVEREGKLVFIQADELNEMEYMPTLSEDFYSLQENSDRKLLFKDLLRKGKGLAQKVFSKWKGNKKSKERIEVRKEPSLERWSNLLEETRKLQADKICEVSEGVFTDGEKRWICNGTSFDNGSILGDMFRENPSSASYQSRPTRQSVGKSDAISIKQGTQITRRARVTKIEYSGIIFCPTVSTGAFVARRNGQVFITGNSGFPKSRNIGLDIDKRNGITKNRGKAFVVAGQSGQKDKDTGGDLVPGSNTMGAYKAQNEWNGWGTALKPAHEPIIMARKPLSEKTVAENCLKWGTGGINIDESRVETDENITIHKGNKFGGIAGTTLETFKTDGQNLGRFPANLIHDNSEEVRECFPETKSGLMKQKIEGGKYNVYGKMYPREVETIGDSGNASRFFKSIKPDNICSLCCLPFNAGYDTMSICNNTPVNSAENNLKITQAITESTALKNATGQVNKNFVQNVRCAGNLCDLCGTSIAQRLAAIMQDQSQESTLGELSMPEHKKQILEKCLVSFVELRGNTDTTPTTENLSLLFGYVLNAIGGYTQKCEDTEGEEKNQWKSLVYRSKASKSERNKGCEGLPLKEKVFNGKSSASSKEMKDVEKRFTTQPKPNNHPTVKPVALMEYLIKMVTPKDGTVFDPFMGSGTTGVACKNLNRNFIGIELDKEYLEIAKNRIDSIFNFHSSSLF